MAISHESSNALDLETVYQMYYRILYNYIYSQLLHRETAEDLTADVFLAALTAADKYSPEKGSLSTWLFAIARNTLRNYYKRASTRKEKLSGVDPALWKLDEIPAADALSVQDSSFNSPKTRKAEQILAQLSENERDLLALRYIMDLSNKEIGELTGLSVSAVSQRFRRLFAKCRKLKPDTE